MTVLLKRQDTEEARTEKPEVAQTTRPKQLQTILVFLPQNIISPNKRKDRHDKAGEGHDRLNYSYTWSSPDKQTKGSCSALIVDKL